jgi:hypothetical protein
MVLIGSDLSMMEALNDYRRPFHQRGRELVIGPLTRRTWLDLLRLPAAEAIDAEDLLVTWRGGASSPTCGAPGTESDD